jgi:hypothetical protein
MNEKPIRGSGLLARRERRADLTAHEQKEMQAALRRDGRQCRVPQCGFKYQKLPVDPCHRVHRGMGGNPKGDRTTRQSVIALCRMHHGYYDRGILLIDPLDETKAFDGPCSFRSHDSRSGNTVRLASEKNGPHN